MTECIVRPVTTMTLMGTAVLVAQYFETIFVIVARTALKCPEARDIDDIAPLPRSAFKQPVRALLNELGRDGHIDEALIAEVDKLLETRHQLVHRVVLGRAAMGSDEEMWQSIEVLSRYVYINGLELSLRLLEIIRAYISRMPRGATQFALDPEVAEYLDKIGPEIRKLRDEFNAAA